MNSDISTHAISAKLLKPMVSYDDSTNVRQSNPYSKTKTATFML